MENARTRHSPPTAGERWESPDSTVLTYTSCHNDFLSSYSQQKIVTCFTFVTTMSTKDFFTLALKLFALYTLIGIIFGVIPSYLSVLTHTPYGDEDLAGAAYAVAAVALLTMLFVYLANKSQWLVTKLKLDRGFDTDRIPLDKLDARTIVKVGCFVIGGVIFLDNLPYFLMHLYAAFRMDVDSGSGIMGGIQFLFGDSLSGHVEKLVINGLNLVISWLLLTNYDFVARKLIGKESEENSQPATNS